MWGSAVTQVVRRLRPAAESGQTMAEYAVVLSVLIIAVVGTITVFSTAVGNLMQSHVVTILTGL